MENVNNDVINNNIEIINENIEIINDDSIINDDIEFKTELEKLPSHGNKGKYKNTKYFVDGEELRHELKLFADSDFKTYTVRLCEMIRLMCFRYTLRWNLIGYSYRDELVEDAFLRCLQQLHHINLEHSNCNPFGYISKIIENSCKATIKKEKKQVFIAESLRNYIHGYEEEQTNNDNNY